MTTIGITDCGKWQNYHDWLKAEGINIIRLSQKEKNIADVDKCNGIVLSGGEDVHPRFYGMPELMEKKKELGLEIHEERDEFELQVIDKAYKKQIPILGICRGLQITNVYFGGTLIPDIEAKNKQQHTRVNSSDKIHSLNVEPNSCLSGIVSNLRGEINSAHHQAADKIGKDLKVTARSKDGIIEAMELNDPTQHPFLLLVQWHPERISNQENPFSKNIKEEFLRVIKK